MSECRIRHEVHGCVGTVILARPDRRNALTREMIVALQRHFDAFVRDGDIRLILLRAEGPVFCAGMDLAEMQARAQSERQAEEWHADAVAYRDLLATLLQAPQPIVAALQGPVLAGGVGLALACDLLVASTNCFFALPEPQRGITAAMVTPLLAYRVGVAHAARLLLSGQQLDATWGLASGLCHRVVPAEQIGEATCELVGSILSGSPQALAQTKQLLRKAYPLELIAALDQAATASAQARETEDAREGLQAFLEKRPPAWKWSP